MTSSSSGPGACYRYSFKILLIGDTGVGKSSLLVSFISNNLVDDLSPTVGVDFKIKHLTIADKKLKLTIWDTAGQERFRTLTSSYYRGSQGIILAYILARKILGSKVSWMPFDGVYDVTKRETFTNIADVWIKEIELYATNQNCIKVLVENKADKESERTVTSEEGIAFANEYRCLFLECSAKTRSNVERCFEELALKILEVPELLEEGSAPAKRNILRQKQDQQANQGGCCS